MNKKPPHTLALHTEQYHSSTCQQHTQQEQAAAAAAAQHINEHINDIKLPYGEGKISCNTGAPGGI
jgi:hypothetical protein